MFCTQKQHFAKLHWAHLSKVCSHLHYTYYHKWPYKISGYKNNHRRKSYRLTYTNFLRKQVKDIVRNVLYYQFGEIVNDDMWDVTIHNQRGETASAEQQAILAIYQAGLCTLETSLRMLHPNWTDRQIKKEQDQLEVQQQQQMEQHTNYQNY